MSKDPRLVLPQWIASELADAARQPDEAGAVLLCGLSMNGTGIKLLGRKLIWVPEDAYDRRTPFALSIRSRGYVGALAEAETLGAVPVWVHTHPGTYAVPRRSEHDEAVDDELKETFRVRSGADIYACLVVSPAEQGFEFTGHVWDGEQHPVDLGAVHVVGERLAVYSPFGAAAGAGLPKAFDRQVRAFGGDVQRVLRELRIGVVGAGGTGSATTEQLARLGVGELMLFDYDELSASNVTRVYGSTPGDVGRRKVDVLADHVRRIAPDTDVEAFPDTITHEACAMRLRDCDVIFGCTDDNAGRLILSRLSSYYLTPVIDLGVLLSSSNGVLQGIDGRITVLTPGAACLVCRSRIDLARAAAEQMDDSERVARQAEGYAPELGGVEPAVITYTSAVASFAVAELLERLVGYGPDRVPSELLLRCHDREISTNRAEPRTRHYCSRDGGVLGAGDRLPFLEQAWRAE